MSVVKRFPGMGERPNARPVYGRDALFLAERLRQDYWRRHKERGELLVYKERLAKNQRRAERVNEVRRIEGFLQSDLTQQARLDYLRPRQAALMKDSGMTALPN